MKQFRALGTLLGTLGGALGARLGGPWELSERSRALPGPSGSAPGSCWSTLERLPGCPWELSEPPRSSLGCSWACPGASGAQFSLVFLAFPWFLQCFAACSPAAQQPGKLRDIRSISPFYYVDIHMYVCVCVCIHIYIYIYIYIYIHTSVNPSIDIDGVKWNWSQRRSDLERSVS